MDYYQLVIGLGIGVFTTLVFWYRSDMKKEQEEINRRKAERVNKFEERVYFLENKLAGAQHRIEQLEKRKK